jgi:TetR/AcrR family transcriptional regulator
MTAREGRGIKTRGAILVAAEKIFAEVGLDGARTEAIAEAAGVNKALLYYYFRSKDALFRAVLENHMKEFHCRAMELLSASDSPRNTLLRYVSAHFDFISARPYYPRLFQRLLMTGGKSFERLVGKYFVPLGQKLVGVIERCMREGDFRCFDSQLTVISLVALTVYYFSVAPMVKVVARMEPYEKHNLARRKKEVLDFIRHGLFRKPEARLT